MNNQINNKRLYLKIITVKVNLIKLPIIEIGCINKIMLKAHPQIIHKPEG